MERSEERDFRRFRERGDAGAMARVFDAVAPKLLLVAGHLARDSGEAEDLVQATFLTAIEDADRWDGSRPLVPWLLGILSNRARNAGRRARSGSARVLDGSEPGPDRLDPGALAADRELQEAIARAVDALEEPYREVLLLRLAHGLQPVEIAHALGRPPGTVRVQLQRCRESLRRALPRGIQVPVLLAGDPGRGLAAVREAVLAKALVAAEGSIGAATLLGAEMTSKTAISAVVAIGTGLVLWGLLGTPRSSELARGSGEPLREAPAKARGIVAARTDPTLGGLESAHDERDVVEKAASEGRSRVEDAVAQAPEPDLPASMAEIRGRFVLEEGGPAAGVSLSLQGGVANDERVREYGLPESWEGVQGESGADGRFALRFEAPRAYQFFVQATKAGRGRASWRWGEILPGRVVDVGEVTVLRAGVIAGRVVDRDGNPIEGPGWSARADQGKWDRAVFGVADVDPSTGAFRIEDMSPGRAELSAYHGMTSWVEGPVVTVVAGETVDADIAFTGGSLGSRISVSTSSMPFHVKSRPDASSIRLLGGTGGPIVAQRVPGVPGTYAFDDLAPGAYTVEIDDPDYLPWRLEGVRPGTEVTARLKGSAALRLNVFDRESGDPVSLYSLRVRFRNVNFGPNEFEVHDGTEPLAEGLFEGMFPGDYTLTVRAESYGATEVDVDALDSGETRAVDVPMGSPVSVAGTVSRGGAGISGVEVALLRPARVDDSSSSPVLPSTAITTDEGRFRRELDAVETDAAGRFAFVAPGGGDYLVLARDGGIEVCSGVIAVQPGEDERFDLVLPGAGKLVGRLRVPEGRTPQGLRVWAGSEGRAPMALSRSLQSDALTLDHTGTFELASLASGRHVVYLLLPERRRSSTSFSNGRPSGAIELGTVDIQEGEVVEREFSLLDRFPGSLRISVTSHGSPLPEARVTVVSRDRARLRTQADAQGVARFDPLFPGVWEVRVDDPEEIWTYEHPDPVTVQADAKAAIDVDVELSEGTLTLVDAGLGEPLAARRLGVRRNDPDLAASRFFPRPLTTDGAGRLTLTLTPGEYRLVLDPFGPEDLRSGEQVDPEAPVREQLFTWTVDGPVDGRVEL